jgi:RNA polymerase sigma-B factor
MSSAVSQIRISRAQRAERTVALLEQLAACSADSERARLREELVLGIPEEDLVQVAYLGLVKAVERFDAAMGHDLLTFAVPTIRGELTRYFRDHGWTVRPPRRIQELQGRLSRTVEQLGQDLGREPTDDEVVAALDVTRSEYVEAHSAYGCFSPSSLDQPVGDDGGGATLGTLLRGEDGPESSRAVEARLSLAPVIRSLGERDRRILHLRFFEEQTQDEIGAELGVSQVQVSRLLSRILDQLREALT